MSNDRRRKGAVEIRRARKSDCEPIAALLAELGYPNTSAFVELKLDELQGIDTEVVVAETGSEVMGMMSLHIVPLLHQDGNLCRVTAMVVSEKERKKGIGRQLLEYAEAFARTRRCIKVEITSGDQRTFAHVFYHRVGYREVSRRFIKVL
jgi:N-acetylglutamate synthase-like GNAT family acetyltransferase